MMFVVGLTQGSFAQEADEVEEQYVYGIVKEATANSLVLTQWDAEEEKDSDVTYSVPADVELENVDSVAGLVEGDSIDVFYVISNGVNEVTAISRYTEEELSGEEEVFIDGDGDMEEIMDDAIEVVPAEEMGNNSIGVEY